MISPQEPVPVVAEGQGPPECCHHWVIEPAQSPVSQGVCQKCHEVRDFHNYFERTEWGFERRPASASAKGSAAARDAIDDYESDPYDR